MARGKKRLECENYFKKGLTISETAKKVGCSHSYAFKVKVGMDENTVSSKNAADKILTSGEMKASCTPAIDRLDLIHAIEHPLEHPKYKNEANEKINEYLNVRLRKAEDEIYYLRQLLKATWEAE